MKKLILFVAISCFSIVCDAQILKIASFRGFEKGGCIALKFTTIRETDTESFFIEKSGDGVHFQRCCYFPKRGDLSEYVFVDSAQKIGCYYRVCERFTNGSESNHPTIFVEMPKILTVFPNPTTGDVTIACDDSPLSIFDCTGRLVHQLQGSGTVSDLPKGVLIVKQGIKTVRLIVQ